MRQPGKLLTLSYWAGMTTAFALSCALQDFLGKEGYIAMVQTNWIEFGPYMWLVWVVLGLTATSVHLFVKSLINKASEQIES